MPWWDFYKLWNYSFEQDPVSKRRRRRSRTPGSGTSQPEAIPDIRQDGSYWGGGQGLIRLRDSNDFIDLSTVANRQSRYKEYERLRNVPEIEQVMTVLADEACVAGNTQVATLFDGHKSIKWLKERWDQEQEDFLVYCYDFEKKDYTLGWAYEPRLVRTAETVKVRLDDGSTFIVTPDHRILLRNGRWSMAGQLNVGDELMPFYLEKANVHLNGLKTKQYPRVFTFDGWRNQQQFIEEWKLGKTKPEHDRLNKAVRMISQGLSTREVQKLMGHQWKSIESWIHKGGFTFKELQNLGKREDRRRVVDIQPHEEIEVYDLSVREHENFATDWGIVHNCQQNDEGDVFDITVENEEVKEELEFLFFHREMLNMNRRIWNLAKKTFIFGDHFEELVMNPDNPKDGILKMQELPPDSVYRIETTKGRLVEFQQGKEGPDYDALTKAPVTQSTESELMQQKAIRFAPEQIIHFKIGDDRNTFYPYGVSLIEPARGPAHQLRLMEDAMVVYRLTRAPERRVFYVDVGQLPPFKAEAFMEKMKDQFRKKKVAVGSRGGGASAVEERWSPQAADEDYWIPIRPNANTRVETLPGAQNLGEIDDALYFRNKLFTALNFPKNYFSNEDVNATRITLSAQDVKFARMAERLQAHLEDGMLEIAIRHLILMGYPEESFDDLAIKMTPPSDYKELSRAEVKTNRINNANSLKGSMLMSDFDIYTKEMKYGEEEAQEMLARMKIQKIEDLKLQVLAQNPQLIGVGLPGGGGEQEIGAMAGGPAPMLGPPPGGGMGGPPGGMPGMPPMPPPTGQQLDQTQQAPGPGQQPGPPNTNAPQGATASPLGDPSDEEIKKFDMEIQNYASEQDVEEIDFSEL